jgi:hypothetical protein
MLEANLRSPTTRGAQAAIHRSVASGINGARGGSLNHAYALVASQQALWQANQLDAVSAALGQRQTCES